MAILFFLSSGLFLGWSLGANDAANVFGTAVGTKMVHFRVAAIICSFFLILGAALGGGGAAHTLGSLGSVNTLPGAFMVALSAAVTVYGMTRLKLPVSTSQAVVGAIIGWNFYSASITNTNSLIKIVSTWVVCPVISAFFAVIIFIATRAFLKRVKIHILRMDAYTRFGLLLVGAFGSYSLGANNIANVMGVFLPVNPFSDVDLFGLFTFTGTQQLFFLGALSIAVGVFTYSHKVMSTVGNNLMKLSPVSALVVVLAQSIVLFIFASEGLEHFLASHGLPTFPLVPVSSSQAVVGAVIGVGIVKNFRAIRYPILGEIAVGWVTTPIIAGVITFISLFFLNNVFNQEVYRRTDYKISVEVIEYLGTTGIQDEKLIDLIERDFDNPITMHDELKKITELDDDTIHEVVLASELVHYVVNPMILATEINADWFSQEQIEALRKLRNKDYIYSWQFHNDLKSESESWCLKEDVALNKMHNKDINQKLKYLDRIFRVRDEE